MNDEKIFGYIRDCFTAGYTLPQFCIDNNLKKVLFVAEDFSKSEMLWEIYVQFCFEKRFKFQTDFGMVLGDKAEKIHRNPGTIFDELTVNPIANYNPQDYDRIFFLTTKRLNVNSDKIIYLEELVNKFILAAYVEIPFLTFLKSRPKVRLFLMNFPIMIENQHITENEKQILQENIPLATYAERLRNDTDGTVKTPYDFLGYTKQELIDLLTLTGSKTNSDGSTTLIDNDNPLIHVENGQRFVPNQPKIFKNKIYFLGGCSHLGVGAPYDKTIPSYIQKLINEKNLPYRVENISQFFTYRYQDIFYNLQKLQLKDGDMVFVFFDNMTSDKIPKFDLSGIFERPHNYGEVYVNTSHVNELGYKAMAEQMFAVLHSNNFFENVKFEYPDPPPAPHRYGIPQENFSSLGSFSQNKELEEYKHKLRAKRFQVGAIVMNGNPFTLGHEYLVEYASKKVKKLYVFVVEEDQSEFKFDDRFKLVQAGVKKFSNVEVLPSGKFIISQKTFSGYFNKENLQDVQVDSSKDVEIFAREIAPSLGITIRFVGEEPEDSVTRQYNETMRNIFPQYNIEFSEIPRREVNGEVISAKKVREALREKDFDTIKKFVPKTTLKFLRDNFSAE
ncbi:MAG: hypothetical protein IK062_11115 [Selenomonadaceae bacterium]|nr:hypothetical protein [Selenomonadaceae bacterium]